MKHYYKIDDPVEIRLIVMYTLAKSQRALTAYEISHIALGSARIDFFEIHDALAFLTKAEELYVFKSMEEKTLYALTPSGQTGADSFAVKLPLEVREYVDECLDELFKENEKRNSVSAKSIPVNFDEFESHLELKDGKTVLLSMNVYAKSDELAKKMCKCFKRNSTKIYDTIINMLSKNISGSDNNTDD